MQRNSDLAGYLTRMYAMFETGDPATTDTLLSREPGILGVGTDPDEWWVDQNLVRAFKAQLPEMHAAGMRFRQGDIQAFSEGTVGWVADQPTLMLPGGSVPMRLTSVWRQEAGAWKMVQFHLSIGVPNQAAIGEQLTT